MNTRSNMKIRWANITLKISHMLMCKLLRYGAHRICKLFFHLGTLTYIILFSFSLIFLTAFLFSISVQFSSVHLNFKTHLASNGITIKAYL